MEDSFQTRQFYFTKQVPSSKEILCRSDLVMSNIIFYKVLAVKCQNLCIEFVWGLVILTWKRTMNAVTPLTLISHKSALANRSYPR